MPRFQFLEKLRNARKVDLQSSLVNQIFGKLFKFLKKNFTQRRKDKALARVGDISLAPLRLCVKIPLTPGPPTQTYSPAPNSARPSVACRPLASTQTPAPTATHCKSYS